MLDTQGKCMFASTVSTTFADVSFSSTEQLTRKPKPFEVNVTPRSDARLEVIQQTVKELHTDIPDIDSIDMDE